MEANRQFRPSGALPSPSSRPDVTAPSCPSTTGSGRRRGILNSTGRTGDDDDSRTLTLYRQDTEILSGAGGIISGGLWPGDIMSGIRRDTDKTGRVLSEGYYI